MGFFSECYVNLKKKRVGYPSVMHFEGRLASGPDGICDIFADFIKRTYVDEVWVPSDPGPDLVQLTYLLVLFVHCGCGTE
jgi:hypothetical protein